MSLHLVHPPSVERKWPFQPYNRSVGCPRRARSGLVRSEERRVGKECRSRCDCSSDVCSSDLDVSPPRPPSLCREKVAFSTIQPECWVPEKSAKRSGEIGRASCRERV